MRRAYRVGLIMALVVGTGVVLRKPLLTLGHVVLLRTKVGVTLTEWLSTLGIYAQKAKPRLLRQEMVDMLYQTVKDVHDVMGACGVAYWIDFGTLLGAVRHQGFIPWDDDIDLSIKDHDAKAFMTRCAPILENLGYVVERSKTFSGVCVYPKDFVLRPHETMPGCDVFFAFAEKGGFRNRGVGVFIDARNLDPLRLYTFGPLQLWGARDPKPYLDAEYGTNWHSLGEMGYDHHTVKQAQGVKKVPFVLKTFEPALPSHPLVDHQETILRLIEKEGQKDFATGAGTSSESR